MAWNLTCRCIFNSIYFGHGMLIFLILTVFWLSETSQICSFWAFSWECIGGIGWSNLVISDEMKMTIFSILKLSSHRAGVSLTAVLSDFSSLLYTRPQQIHCWLHVRNKAWFFKVYFLITWWRHQMETFSALLALCMENWPVTGEFPLKGQWRGALIFSLICAWINGSVNNREAGDLRRHHPHYDVTVMSSTLFGLIRR